MSWQAVTWVLEFSESTLGSRLVAISIASHANNFGEDSYPSVQSISRETKLSRREVFYCLKALKEAGELGISTGNGRNGTNRYRLLHVRKWVQSLHPVQDTTQVVQSTARRGATDCTRTVLNRPMNRNPRAQTARRSAMELEAFNAGPSYR